MTVKILPIETNDDKVWTGRIGGFEAGTYKEVGGYSRHLVVSDDGRGIAVCEEGVFGVFRPEHHTAANWHKISDEWRISRLEVEGKW